MSERHWTVIAPLTPRFRDTDAMGHINNAVYVTYLEVARQEYWLRLKGMNDYGAVPFILAHVELDFRSEALVHESLDLCVRCPWVGGKSFAYEYEIREHQTQRLVVAARSVQVCYDYEARRSIPMPAELRKLMESFEGRRLDREGNAAAW